jgi:hypothetical protein
MREWLTREELPFPECRGHVLRELTIDLARLLPKVEAVAIEEEVVEFTEKRGWHKLDKLMPAIFEDTLNFRRGAVYLLENIHRFPDHWKASDLPLFGSGN